MTTVSDTINSMKNATAQEKATTSVKSTEITGDTFLQLMTEQLENQDPLDPMSNSDMLAQEAQFTSLSKTEEMSSNIASNNSIMQALSMVGASVSLTDPDNSKKTITGTVTSASLNGSSSSIVVNGKTYPVANVTKVTPLAYTTTTDSSSSSSSSSSASSSSSSGSSSSSSSSTPAS